ncbi:unnamed protein product [Nezara viridula]|uniref:Uncharacterized protein n=1 Tax=Nezara viridula TaxID=85310 RepID=A0A9P0HB04_NEZVI|nr:unnamed protein product [Nezara viridula]
MACQRDVLEIVREDDFVEYFLFSLDNFDEESATQTVLNLKSQVTDLTKKGSENYIWQKDEFVIIPRNTSTMPPIVDNEETLPPHLYGVTHYGENIEDEWFIVHLLVELTKNISGLIARVIDVDGEFLLIEGADHLPSWASPEICDKRVYIYRGEIHIVPPRREREQISLIQALATIRANPDKTRASQEIQDSIKSRLRGYPEKVFELLHQTTAYVPSRVAALLRARPSLIAPAVTAFCHRDPIDTRAMRAMRNFPPETRVMTTVKMTRCQYAMLSQAKYTPDRRTGWQLPSPTSPLYLPHTIGVKLACGFEILVTQAKSPESIEADKGWLRYKQSLTEKGYFKEFLEGSQDYNRLENEAKEYYRTHSCYSQPPLATTVVDLLETIEVDEEGLKKAESSLPPPDDDSWMTISGDDLERMMKERYGARPQTTDITSSLTAFLNNISGLDGVQHPKPSTHAPEVPLRQKRNKKTEETRDDENNRISFDQEAFTCALNNILDFSVPEDSWDLDSDESGMSSYEDEAEMDLSRKKNTKSNSAQLESDSELKQYMDQMDRELQGTTLGQSFIKKKPKGMEDSFSDIESFEPVDIDMNAVRNMLASYEAQVGGPGPATNILGPMGVSLQRH